MPEIQLPSAGTIIDSHAHVLTEYFPDDQDEVIQRAFSSGVCQFVNPGVTLETIPELVALADRFEQIYLGLGVHPHEAKNWTADSLETLRTACEHKKVVAIGECGLDFFYNNSDEVAQELALREQVRLAVELDKPVIIHCRDAWEQAFEILEQEGQNKLRGVFHCFTGGAELLERIARLDFYVSFSGIVSFPNAKNIQQAAAQVRQDRMLVETDCPFLAPQKVRGKRNEPSYVWFVAEKLAQLRNQPLSQIADSCRDNARALFRLPQLS